MIVLFVGCGSFVEPYPILEVPIWYEPLYTTVSASVGIDGDFMETLYKGLENDTNRCHDTR